jgi:hypothetical protein
MKKNVVRWASSEGAFLFQVPEEEWLFTQETIILLSSGIYAFIVYLAQGDIKLNGENLSIIRINVHPPFLTSSEQDSKPQQEGYVIHSSYKDGFCLQSIFNENDITPELSQFEKALLDSVVENVLERLAQAGRHVSDIPFLRDQTIIHEIEDMLEEIDNKYKALAASWVLSRGPECEDLFSFSNVHYNGKIQVADMMYDLGEKAFESIDEFLFSKEEKIVLYKIARSLLGLSSLIFEGQEVNSYQDPDVFTHTEIIVETNKTKKLYRLDVRSYGIEDVPFCDVTIMS